MVSFNCYICETERLGVRIFVRSFASFRFISMLAAGVTAAAGTPCDPLRFDQAQNLGVVQSADITEGSGLAASWRNPGVLWTHNDGSRDILYAITTDGRLLGKYHL